MEGCPRSSMLNIDLKDSASSELAGPLKKYITEHYQEDAENYKHECLQLEQLRSTCLHPSHDHSGCSVLRRYFAQLQFLQSRFPMIDGGDVPIPFTWTDLYSEEAITLSDIRFEQASVLHNLGALHSQLGSKEDRTGEEGMKVACTHFQAAAGVFQYLKTTVMVPLSSLKLPWVSEDHFAVPFFDLAGCVLQLYINILLGQAQECLLEKSILDGRKDSLVARISMQVYDYYQQALGILESLGSSYMGSKKSKTWTKAIKIKACHFLCVSYMYMSNHAHENQMFGEKVAYLKSASQKLTEAQKQSKGQPERTLEMLQFMADVISQKLEGAVKDNDFIYHEVVPDLTTLSEIKGAPLVKPIPFQPCDPSASGPDIFQRLIPIEAHSDASIYSEEKAKLLRRYNASVDAKNKQLSQSLASLHIDDLLQPVETDTLPSLLKEKHETLRKEVALLSQTDQNIQESLKLSEQIDNTMKDISSLLEEDEKKELIVKEICGPRPSPPERDEFKKEIEKCQDALSKANQTNTELVRVYNAHKQNLELIAGPEDRLLSALPSLNIIDSPVDDGAVQRLRDLIAKVEEMKTQRKMLEENLRKQLNEDDITGLLVTREDSNKMAFFDEQLKKHDSACSLIQANVDAQDRILSALTEANAKYAKTRQAVKENSQRREEVVQALILSYNTFCELQGKLSRGVQFYQNLLQTVTKIEEKCKDFFDGHSKELDKLVEKIKAASEPPKPPSRPLAAKPDRLVRPQPAMIHSPLPNSMVPGQVPTSFLEHRHPNTMYQHPGMLPGQLPQSPGTQVDGRSIHGPGYVDLTLSQIPPDTQSNIPQHVHRPGQAVPGQVLPGHVAPGQVVPGHIPGHSIGRPRPDGILASHPYGPSRSEFLPQPGPQRQVHIPADQLIHSTPRMSYPFPVMQGQVSAQLSKHNVPGQSIPGQSIPGQSMLGQSMPGQSMPGQSMPGQSIPGQSIPGQSIPGQSIPGQSMPGQSMLGQSMLGQSIPGQSIPGQSMPGQSMPGQSMPGHSIPGQPVPGQSVPYAGGPGTQLPSSQYQVRPRQQEPPRPANVNTSLGQTQQIRPAWFTQAPQQPGMVRGQQFTPKEQIQPRFPGQQNIRSQFFPQQPQQQRYPGGMRPQTDLNPQLRGSFPVQNQRPSNPPQQMPFQQQFRPHGMQPTSTSSQIRPSLPQPMHVSQQGPRNTSPGQLPSSLQSNPMSPTLNSPSSSQQLLRPHSPMQSGQQPMQQPQHQFQQPALPQQQQQPFPSSSVHQRLPRPGENQNQSIPQQLPFSPSQQTQPPFRTPFQQPIRSAQPSQPSFRPQQASQQQFRPQQPTAQPFRPQQASQQPFRPQQPSQQPFRPQQPSQQPFRPQQPPQQPIQPTQPFQQTIHPEQLSQVNQQMQQPFQSGQTSQTPFRPEQLSQQPPLPGQVPSDVPPGRQFQQTHFPGQQTQLPFRIESQSHQPLRSEQPAPQTSKLDRQPQNSLQTDNHPVQSFQPPPFAQQTQQPYSTDQQPRQPARPDQPPQPFQVGQRPRMPFTPRQPPPEQQPKDLPGPQQPAVSTYYQNKQPVRPQKQLNQTDGGTATSGQLPSQPFQIEQQPPHQLSQQNPLLAHQNTNKTHSYSETGAFLSGQPNFPPDYPQVRPIPTSILSQSSRPSRSSVTSSDYLTSYSVALAQTQLSQYQNTASSQQQMQQFQQQLLLQQQQLILQQQEMLRQQQTQHSHESDQSQIGLLLQQIIQQQKQLTDLEVKIKDKKEDENSKKSTNSSESIEVQEQKPQPNLEQTPQQSKAAEAEGRDEKSVSCASDNPALEKNEEAKPKNILVSTASSSSVTNSVLPDYETASKWFTDLANKQLTDTEYTGDSTDGSSKTAKDESDSMHDTSITSEGSVNIKAARDSSGKSDEDENDDTQEQLSGKKEETIDKKIESDEEEESENQGSALKEEGSSQPVDTEETHKHEIEEQIQHIKELQSNPNPSQPSTGYLYEPGKLPDNISAATNERRMDRLAPNEHRSINPPERPDAAKPSLHRQCGHYYESQISSLGQDANNSCLSDDETLQLLVSAVEGFDQVVKSLVATKHGTKADGFTLEWKDLERLQELDSTTMSTHAAAMNQSKNRYRDILPWDHTRVKLESKEESDYINANIVKDITPLSPSFIATQGPIATTLADFWMMVWEQQCSLIVMLTKEVEGDRLMCHQYWPIDEGHTVLFGPLRVSLKTLVTLPSFVKRVMHVQHNDGQDTLVVTHFQFTGWPDKGVPESPADLLAFMVEVRGCYQQQGSDVDKPILIHCSAGIGRTGTFIVIFAAMEEFDAHKGFVNIPRLVRNLRLQRKYMVQKKEQYEFCYRTVLFYALQFLDLELASIAFKRKSTKENSNLVKQAPEKVLPSAPFCENDDEENSDLDTTRKDKEADVLPTDTRQDSSNVRFLGELKSDDSVDEEDSNDKEKEEDNLVNNEQLISEKYCKGTLETDEKPVKEHDETHEPDRKDSAEERMKTGKSLQSQTQDEAPCNLERTGTNALTASNDAVSIGKHSEVRHTKGEISSNENGKHDEGVTSSNENGKHDEGVTSSNENSKHDARETSSNENGVEMPRTEESEETVEHVDRADAKEDIESTSQSGTERETKVKENDNVEDSSLLDKGCDIHNTVGDNLDSA